ncbi:MAG TPA: hypothetical protein VGY56_06705 [Verrucomicrobiae bacterium]|nr:hypothetical protein [Verrucomicrobiae bacterium]
MDTTTVKQAPEKGVNQGHDHATVRVVVSYAAAVRPYKAEVADNTTIGQVKTAVLDAFGLQETNTKKYQLFHGKTELSNLSETVGQAAGHHRELHLKLEEVIVQG